MRLRDLRSIKKTSLIGLLLFVAGSLLALGWVAVKVGDLAPFASRTTYKVELTDALGLQPGDPVKIAGVDVGQVESLSVKRGMAVAVISINSSIKLPRGTQTGISWRNVLGQMALYLYPPSAGQPLGPGATIPASAELPSANLARLLGTLQPFLAALDPSEVNSFVVSFDEALQGQTAQVRQLITNGAQLASALSSEDAQLGATIDEFNQVIGAYAQRRADLARLINELNSLSSVLAQHNDLISSVISNLSAALDDLAQLASQNHQEITQLIDQLNPVVSLAARDRQNVGPTLTSLSQLFGVLDDVASQGQWLSVKVVYTCLAGGLDCQYYQPTEQSLPNAGSALNSLGGILGPLTGGQS